MPTSAIGATSAAAALFGFGSGIVGSAMSAAWTSGVGTGLFSAIWRLL